MSDETKTGEEKAVTQTTESEKKRPPQNQEETPAESNMRISKTGDILKDLKQSGSLTDKINRYDEDFVEGKLCLYMKSEIEKSGITKAQVIRDSGINRRFFFDILSSKRHPTRNYVLRLFLALKTPFGRAQRILRASGYAVLFARDKRDAIIIYSIIHNQRVEECNEKLKKHDLDPI